MNHPLTRDRRPLSRRIALVATAAVLSGLAACGDKPENEGFPPTLGDLGPGSASPATKARDARWSDLRKALGIDAPGATSDAELKAQLATPSTLLTDPAKAADYQKLLGQVSTGYAKSAYATRCAAIVGAQELGAAKLVDADGKATDYAGAKMYVVKYKLQKDATGTAEDGERSALVTVPTQGFHSAPLVMYGHGGEAGLSIGEVAQSFGELQGAYIVAAPTFPGEALCPAALDYVANTCVGDALVKGTGTVSPFDSDVDELLGLHNCLVRAALPAAVPGGGLSAPVLDATGKPNGIMFENVVSAQIKSQGGSRTYAAFPQSILAGASRGALVAGLALAKTGAALGALATDPAALGPAYFHPSLFSCEALLFPPATVTVGEYRILFESLIKGTVESTAFVGLPMVRKLNTLLAPYRAGTISAAEAAQLIAARDLTLTGPLMIAALRDWSEFGRGTARGGQGALAFLHGLNDKIVPYNQTLITSTILETQSKTPAVLEQTQAPGIDVFARGFQPAEAYVTVNAGRRELAAGQTQHGDASFYTATSVPVKAPSAAAPVGADATSLLGVTPAAVLAGWLTQGACAKALTP